MVEGRKEEQTCLTSSATEPREPQPTSNLKMAFHSNIEQMIILTRKRFNDTRLRREKNPFLDPSGTYEVESTGHLIVRTVEWQQRQYLPEKNAAAMRKSRERKYLWALKPRFSSKGKEWSSTVHTSRVNNDRRSKRLANPFEFTRQ